MAKQSTNKPRGGFASHKKKARNNMEIPDLLVLGTEPLLTAVTYHAALAGACFMQNTNRARSAIKWTLLLDDDREEFWANTPEEAVDALGEINDLLIETCRDRGYLPAPVIGNSVAT